jgi:serine/threonine protein kinase
MSSINSSSEFSNESSYTSSEISESSDDNVSQNDNLNLNSKIINDYNVLYELGRGSYSIVWLAYNISNQKFYALKVQNPTEYKEGLSEINFVTKLPQKPQVFNNIYESFIETIDDNKYLCSVWNLHSTNLDSLIRKGNFNSGLPIDEVKNIMRQLISAIKILHQNFKVFHGDIKTDNILVKGVNARDEYIINEYINEKFNEKYLQIKKDYWIKKGNSLTNINKMNKKIKMNLRQELHEEITNRIMEKINEIDISKYLIDSKYLKKIQISLGDFGTYCSEDNYYDKPFGTRYYQAPEIILMGKCSYPVDIWALGCTFYELLTGKLLFDPNKDSKYSRDYYHLCLINDTCGKFPSSFLKKTKFYNDFFDSKFNIIDHHNTSSNNLNNFINQEIMDRDKILSVLSRMLDIDPNKRITIRELHSLTYFN